MAGVTRTTCQVDPALFPFQFDVLEQVRIALFPQPKLRSILQHYDCK
jgi:hypothetical protein